MVGIVVVLMLTTVAVSALTSPTETTDNVTPAAADARAPPALQRNRRTAGQSCTAPRQLQFA